MFSIRIVFIAVFSFLLITPLTSVCQSGSDRLKMIERVNELNAENRKEEGAKLFQLYTDKLLSDSAVELSPKIISCLTIFSNSAYFDYHTRRKYLLVASDLAKSGNEHSLFYDKMSEIAVFYSKMAADQPEFYDSLKAPAYKYSSIMLRTSRLTKVSDSLYQISILVGKGLGIYDEWIGVRTTPGDNEMIYLAKIDHQTDSSFVYSLNPYEQTDFQGFDEKILLEIDVRLPDFGDSYIEPLYLEYNAFFTDNSGGRFHTLPLLLSADYQKLKPIFDAFVTYQIKEVYEELKGDSLLMLKPESGVFKGKSIGEAFKETTYSDINLFFDFVYDYVRDYYGKNSKISDSYATWLINNAPLSNSSLTRYFMRNEVIQDDLILKYNDELVKNNLLNYWKEQSIKSAQRFQYQEAVEYEKLRLKAAEILSDPKQAFGASVQLHRFYRELNNRQVSNRYATLACDWAARAGIDPSAELSADTSELRKNVVVQNNHTTPYEMEYSPSGRHFYTAGLDGKIKVWDAGLNKLIREFRAHDYKIRAMDVRADGGFLATGDEEGFIKIWRIVDSELILFKTFRYNAEINEIHISTFEGANFLAFCGESKDVLLYNWELDKLRKLTRHKKEVTALAFNSKGSRLYSGSRDGMIYEWSVSALSTNWNAKTEIIRWFKEPPAVFQLNINPDNSFMSVICSDSTLSLWELKTASKAGKVNIYMYADNGSAYYSPAVFSPDNKYLVFAGNMGTLSIADLSNFKFMTANHLLGELISDIDFHPSGQILATTSYSYTMTKIWDLSRFDISAKNVNLNNQLITFTSAKAIELNFDSTGNRLITLLNPPSGPILTSLDLSNGESTLIEDRLIKVRTLKSWQNAYIVTGKDMHPVLIENGEVKNRFLNNTGSYDDIHYLMDDKRKVLYSLSHGDEVNLTSKNLIANELNYTYQLTGTGRIDSRSEICLIDDVLFLSNHTPKISTYKASTGEATKKIKTGFRNNVHSIRLTDNQELLIVTKWYIGNYNPSKQEWNWKYKYRKRNQRNVGELISTAQLSADGRFLALADKKYGLKLLEPKNQFNVYYVDSSSGEYINDVAFNPQSSILAYCNEENLIKLIDINAKKEMVKLFPQKTGSFIWLANDNHYWAKKSDLENIAFEINGKLYPAEQFDIAFNRPDRLLKSMPIASENLLHAMGLAAEKRSNSRKSLSQSLDEVPNINLKNKADIPAVTSESEVVLRIEAFDFTSELALINVSVDGVIVLRLPVSGNEWDSSLTISLAGGLNRIKIWAENKIGIASLKESTELMYEAASHSDLYIVALSVSEYSNKDYNLRYAVKDGRDLVAAFVRNQDSNANIYVDTFFNERVTVSCLSEIENKLKKAGINDQIIFFISGHGLLDDQYDFYFAGYNCNFKNPREGGIAYADIMKVLENTKARKRILLIDACHSGEVDKSELELADSAGRMEGTRSGVKTYVYRGAEMEEEEGAQSLGLTNSFELMKELFSDFNSNGTQVISAAAGNSYALESDEWQNGVFTYSILHGLKDQKADLDEDFFITVSELRRFVAKTVYELTGGRQKPTSREENVEFDFIIW